MVNHAVIIIERLDCGKEFAHNWAEMRIGEPVPARMAATEAQSIFRQNVILPSTAS